MTQPFCSNCDRVRITSDGRFLTCLFENRGYDLKSLMRSGKSDDDIRIYILECIKKKPEGVVSIIRTNKLRPRLNLMHTIGGWESLLMGSCQTRCSPLGDTDSTIFEMKKLYLSISINPMVGYCLRLVYSSKSMRKNKNKSSDRES